jgi:hypothetical protein
MLHALPDDSAIARTLDEALRSTVSVQLALLGSGIAMRSLTVAAR